MSYSIIYKKQFIKTADGRIITMRLQGDNNVYRGNRRARDWYGTVGTEEEHMKSFQDEDPNEEGWYYKIGSRCVNAYQLGVYFKNGIKHAKTLEELNKIYYNVSICGVKHGCNEQGYYGIQEHEYAHTSEELAKLLDKGYTDFMIFNEEIFDRRNLRLEKITFSKPKDKPTEFYAIKNNLYTGAYIYKRTSRKLQFHNPANAKPFRTEKEAQKYIDTCKSRGFKTETFTIEKIKLA